MQDTPLNDSETTRCGSPLREPKQEIWRIIKPVAEARRVRTKRTLASLALGQGSRAEARLFQWGARDGLPLRTLWTAWYVGLVAGLLALVEVVPAWCVWVATLMTPLPLVTVALLSKDLVLEILHELDFYLIQILQGVALTHGLVETWKDERRFFWLLYLPSLIVAPLVDAYPAKYRPRFIQLYFVGMLCILVGWNVFELSKKSLHFFTYNVGDLATLSLFYLRQIYAATWQKDNYVLISCAMYTALERVSLNTHGSGLQPEPQTVRVAPPRSYSFNTETHPLTDWQRAHSPNDGAAAFRAPNSDVSSSEPEASLEDGIFGSLSSLTVSAGLVPAPSGSAGAPPRPGTPAAEVPGGQGAQLLGMLQENEEECASPAASQPTSPAPSPPPAQLPSGAGSGAVGAEGAGPAEPARAEV